MGRSFQSAVPISGYLPLAGVAQLVEQRFRKPQVARSIRVAGSIILQALPRFAVLPVLPRFRFLLRFQLKFAQN